MEAAGLATREEAALSAIVDDAVASSAIEGEVLAAASVRSSIVRRLGNGEAGVVPVDSRADGMAEILLDATRNYALPLTEARIFECHRGLFPRGMPERDVIDVGCWRKDARGRMKIVSSTYGGGRPPRVHFEAHPAARLGQDMAAFLAWFNGTMTAKGDLVRAGLAHLWFVVIHPLDDGNGRIGRAIADMAIAQAERSGQRFYALSGAIQRSHTAYYEALENASSGSLDVTAWLLWFLQCHRQAIDHAAVTANHVIAIARFWTVMDGGGLPLNARQRRMVSKFLEHWEGLVTTKTWVAVCGCSTDTAQRDIAGLVARGLLKLNAKGGRSVGYIPTVSLPDHEGTPQ